MKRNLLRIATLCLILFAGWLFIDLDRLFTDIYYVKVPSTEQVNRDASTYTYEVIAYDEDGKKRPIKLETQEFLGAGEFLKVYVKEGERVTSFEPASETDVPWQLKDEQTDEPATTPLP